MKLPTKLQTMCLALVLGTVAGCADLREVIDDMYATNVYRRMAREAWQSLYAAYPEIPYPEHFGAGFRSGYVDVASGNAGCLPPMPPRQYWSMCYSTPCGRQMVRAWYEGYAYGVMVAEQDGVAYLSDVPNMMPDCSQERVEEVAPEGDPAAEGSPPPEDAVPLEPAPAPNVEGKADEETSMHPMLRKQSRMADSLSPHARVEAATVRTPAARPVEVGAGEAIAESESDEYLLTPALAIPTSETDR